MLTRIVTVNYETDKFTELCAIKETQTSINILTIFPYDYPIKFISEYNELYSEVFFNFTSAGCICDTESLNRNLASSLPFQKSIYLVKHTE